MCIKIAFTYDFDVVIFVCITFCLCILQDGVYQSLQSIVDWFRGAVGVPMETKYNSVLFGGNFITLADIEGFLKCSTSFELIFYIEGMHIDYLLLWCHRSDRLSLLFATISVITNYWGSFR